MMLYSVFVAVAVVVANAAHSDKCPEVKPMENFNLTAYEGVWYEVSKSPHDSEKDGKCAISEYKKEGDVVKVKNSHVIGGVQTYYEGTVKLAPDANGTGKLLVTLTLGDKTKDAPVAVLATDYTTYAIVYNCKFDEKKKTHEDFVWILTRGKTLEGAAKTAVDDYLKAHAKDLETTNLSKGDLSDEACKFNSTRLITDPTKH